MADKDEGSKGEEKGKAAPTTGEGAARKTPRRRSRGTGGGMTVAEAGRKGGQAVRDKYGPGFYEAIGRKGGEAVKAERGHAFYEEIGRKGGEAVKAERGHAFYEEIGRKGGESVKASRGAAFYEEIGKRGGHRVRELIQDARRSEEDAPADEKTREDESND